MAELRHTTPSPPAFPPVLRFALTSAGYLAMWLYEGSSLALYDKDFLNP